MFVSSSKLDSLSLSHLIAFSFLYFSLLFDPKQQIPLIWFLNRVIYDLKLKDFFVFIIFLPNLRKFSFDRFHACPVFENIKYCFNASPNCYERSWAWMQVQFQTCARAREQKALCSVKKGWSNLINTMKCFVSEMSSLSGGVGPRIVNTSACHVRHRFSHSKLIKDSSVTFRI